MAAKVIQGTFLSGYPRVSAPSIQPSAMPRLPGPPPTAFAPPKKFAQPKRVGPPRPAFVPPPAARQGGVAQRHGASDAFAIDPGRLGLAGGGRPLPEGVRGKMEAALGADFSNVRVHIGPQAERIGAIAFTIGSG